MTITALEEHVLPVDVLDATGIAPQAMQGLTAALDDVGEARPRAMDAAGIDIQVLSAIRFFLQGWTLAGPWSCRSG